MCKVVRLPTPLQLLHMERLRLRGLMLARRCDPVQHVLESGIGGGKCWLSATTSAIQWTAATLPRHFPSGWQQSPDGVEVYAWITENHAACSPLFCEAKAPPLCAITCPICSFVAKNATGLTAHLAHSHGMRSLSRRLADSTNFWTRTRVLRHIRRSTKCLEALQAWSFCSGKHS